MNFDPARERALYQLHRTTDPVTSREAAASILPRLTKIQSEILSWAKKRADFTDRDLVASFDYGPSTLRTRRKELCEAGLIVRTGEVEINNRTHTLWSAA